MCDLVTTLAEAGKRRQAVRLAEDAADIAEAISDSRPDGMDWFFQPYALVSAVRALAGAGELDRATATAATISDPERRGQAQVAVVGALVDSGKIDSAVAAAIGIADSAARVQAETILVQALDGIGKRRRALVLADRAATAAAALEASMR
ncbi:hypothetical protein [Kribbella sp. NBC_00359]|uniref:hypothetical protein n=1 Tax=Kribbella sp. NBC_00359 TaxID=2975966 RepID=UPI002E24B317